MGFNGFFINKTQNPTQSPSESGFFFILANLAIGLFIRTDLTLV